MSTGTVDSIELRVREIGDARRFYGALVGLDVLRESNGRVAFGEDGEIVALRESPQAPGRGGGEAGLFHLAIRFPDRQSLADSLVRLRSAEYPLKGASDHAVSEALYTVDPAGNEVELYRDRPEAQWEHDGEGRVRMTTRRLDLSDLTGEASTETPRRAPAGTDLGHVHLEVTDLERAVEFYGDLFGMEIRATRRGAAFMAWNGYHHHVGMNTWRGRREPRGPDSVGVERIRASVADEVLRRVRERTDSGGMTDNGSDDSVEVVDPDGIRWALASDATQTE